MTGCPFAARMRGLAAVLALALTACAGTPVPDWQMNAHGALQRAVAAQLAGNERVARAEFDRARSEIAATGRVDLMARAELTRCAAQAASLQFEPCAGFERLRPDAPLAEQAYADLLSGRLTPAQRPLLPAAQQALAQPGRSADADLAALQAVAQPLSRLLGAALVLRDGRASPALLQLAVDTASEQGWRRPLLAWLRQQQQAAERSGDAAEASRLGRRIELVLQGAGAP